MLERKLKRYGAYFFGWCQAFGEHEIALEEDHDIYWLLGESKVGVAVAPRLRRRVLKEILKQRGKPLVTLAYTYAQINELKYVPTSERDKLGLKSVVDMIKESPEVHLFLTSHFCYPAGTKILTLSTKKPLIIFYKEIEPLTVRVV
jgi:hypothetical protein